MEGKLFCFLLALQIVTLSSATSKPLAPNDGFGVRQPGQNPESLKVSLGPSSSSKEISLQSHKSKQGKGAIINKEAYVEMEIGKLSIGPGRPSCEHKCYGCTPCEAIQVPTTTSKRSHVSLQYANYEPMSWKCKCGPSFYSP